MTTLNAFSTGAAPRRQQVIANGVLGMLIFVIAEAMFFAGLISAFMIVRASAPGGIWPPSGQPRLPADETAFNTAMLLLSGVMLWVAHGRFRKSAGTARTPLLWAILLGASFVVLQGVEWVALIREGLTLTSSAHGGFFYLIVGMHAAHAVVALGVLSHVFAQLVRGRLHPATLWTAEVFWYFVVGLWPFLYLRVYF
ncbi:MAG: cytochrome c oxidase subunit 3 [Myxococcota bacterium]